MRGLGLARMTPGAPPLPSGAMAAGQRRYPPVCVGEGNHMEYVTEMCSTVHGGPNTVLWQPYGPITVPS